MKKLFAKIKNAVISFIKMLWAECRDVKTIILFLIVCAVIGIPVWGGFLLGFIFKWEWALWVAGVSWAFWMLPGAPFFTVSVAVTLTLKRVILKGAIKRYEERKKMSDNEDDIQSDPEISDKD